MLALNHDTGIIDLSFAGVVIRLRVCDLGDQRERQELITRLLLTLQRMIDCGCCEIQLQYFLDTSTLCLSVGTEQTRISAPCSIIGFAPSMAVPSVTLSFTDEYGQVSTRTSDLRRIIL